MIRGMFRTFGMEESRRDDYDIDAWLEHSEEELQESFLEFYHDVLPELKSVGKVVQFKVRWDQDCWCVYVNLSNRIIRFLLPQENTRLVSLMPFLF